MSWRTVRRSGLSRATDTCVRVVINVHLHAVVARWRRLGKCAAPDISTEWHQSRSSRLGCGIHVVENFPCTKHVFSKDANLQEFIEPFTFTAEHETFNVSKWWEPGIVTPWTSWMSSPGQANDRWHAWGTKGRFMNYFWVRTRKPDVLRPTTTFPGVHSGLERGLHDVPFDVKPTWTSDRDTIDVL